MGDAADLAGRVPEDVRNRRLRRIDWRFLGHDPWGVPGIVSAPPLLTSALSSLGGPAPTAHEMAGFAALVDPSASELARAFESLPPGGSCYCEWTRPTDLPGRVERRLHVAGFVAVAAYWPWPHPERANPEIWLPLNSESAADWFLDSRRPTGDGHLRSALRRVGWGALRSVGGLRPICTIACRPGGCSETWLERFANACSPEGQPGPTSWLLRTGGRRAINKVVSIGFAGGLPDPTMIVKFARTGEAEDALYSEAANLRRLHDRAPGGLPGAPKLIGASPVGSPVAIAESYESGVPLMATLNTESHHGAALAVTDWLVALARATRCPSPDWRARLVQAPLARFADDYRAVVDDGALEATRSRLAALDALPGVFEQRDCSPWNVLRDSDGSLVVLDWESAEPFGLPALDLVYYLTFAALAVEGTIERGSRGTYRRLRDTSTSLGHTARECELRYLTAVGVDPRSMPALRLLTWIVHARAEHDRLTADGGGSPDVRALGNGVFIGLWREELGLLA